MLSTDELNRVQRRARGLAKKGMNEVEFQRWLKAEVEWREEAFKPSAMAIAVRQALRHR